MFISLIKNNYFLQLVSCLSGLFCSYKLIKLIYEDWKMNQKNLKLLQSSSDFQKIKQEIKNTQLTENQLLSLKNTIISGIIKQDENSKSEFQNQIIKIQNGKIRKMVSYFEIEDHKSDRIVVDFKASDITLDLFRRYSQREENKNDRKINLLGYQNLFSITLSNFQSIEVETPIVLLCDLILNKRTDILRCNRIIKMGTKQSMQNYLKWKIFKNFMLFFVMGIVTLSFLNVLKFIHNKKHIVKTYINNATISKGNETQRCGYCKQNVINALFSPCGHFNFCYECSNKYENCPNCGNYINDIIKVFKS